MRGPDGIRGAAEREPCSMRLLVAPRVAVQNKSGHNALTAACRFGQFDAVEMLLNVGADANLETTRGSYVLTATHHDVSGVGDVTPTFQRTDVAVSCGARRSPLLEACMFKHMKIIRLLLKRNAVIAKKNRYGLSVLDMARRLDLGEVRDYVERKNKIYEAQRAMFIAIST